MEKHHAERLIIIPSSTHEVLLIPCDPETDVLSFNEMVQEVNATQLMPEEVLSDNAYIYDGNEMKIIEQFINCNGIKGRGITPSAFNFLVYIKKVFM